MVVTASLLSGQVASGRLFQQRRRYLTAEETNQLSEDVKELVARYRAGGAEKGQRAPGALPVRFVAFAHPLPPTPSGN
jgi:hypothetical protein